jgi:hypothetical protein
MRDIYQSSYRVYIWLGESETARLALSMFTQLILLKEVLSRSSFIAYVFGLFSCGKEDAYISAMLTAFLDLLHHPWFSRIWVIQEVAVAPATTILYGGQSFVWEYFNLIEYLLGDPETTEISSLFQYSEEFFAVREAPTGPAHASLMTACRRMWRKGDEVQLYTLLRNFSAFKSTDPRDKIFALVGLVGSGNLESLVDYEKGLEETLCLVGDHFIERDELLEILQFAGIGLKGYREGIPSWVVDWSKEKIPVTLAHGIQTRFRYCAATHLRPIISRRSSPKSIKIHAKIVSTIKVLGSNNQPPSIASPLDGMEALTPWILEASSIATSHIPEIYPLTQQPVNEAFWRTLIGDKTLASRPAPSSFTSTFTTLLDYCKALQDLPVDLQNREALTEALHQSEFFQTWNGYREFMREILNAGWICWHKDFPRTFAILENRGMGLVPWGSAVGDVVVVPWGSEVPFVIREVEYVEDGLDGEKETRGRRWRLVGECYVHGVMDGEVFGADFGWESEEFEIV